MKHAEPSVPAQLWASRELLKNLTARELKVRYKRSALGFVWSLLNPLLMMGVFTIVFTIAFDVPIKDFPIFFLIGYLPWSFFQASVQVSTGAIVGNANLVRKVSFPRESLPLAVVMSQLVHFALAMLVLFGALVFAGYAFWPFLPAFLLATLILFILATGTSLLFAAANTMFRDIQEFSNVLFLLWFYLTPIVYSPEFLPDRYRWILRVNPMTYVVEMMRDSLYRLRWPAWETIGAAAAFAIFILLAGAGLFRRLAADFAKEV